MFLEFSMCGNETNQRHFKRRKVSIDSSGGGKLETLPGSMETVERNVNPKTTDRSCKSFRTHSFENAKECLLSLKRSVADLHQKKLFPYNPRPLLKRFVILFSSMLILLRVCNFVLLYVSWDLLCCLFNILHEASELFLDHVLIHTYGMHHELNSVFFTMSTFPSCHSCMSTVVIVWW